MSDSEKSDTKKQWDEFYDLSSYVDQQELDSFCSVIINDRDNGEGEGYLTMTEKQFRDFEEAIDTIDIESVKN